MRVLVLGGYGVFGGHVCRELAEEGLSVRVAGRDAGAARAFAAVLGPGHDGVAADATDRRALRAALDGCGVLVNCAGPFSALGEAAAEACLESGRHAVDISDDRGWAARLRTRDAAFRARGLFAVYGASSLPALSLALAERARARLGRPCRARVTLFIGNANRKGAAAITSALACAGRPIRAPQGTILGFRDPERVELPAPFGARTARNFDSPDYDLLALAEVRVKVAFESVLANLVFGLLARLPFTAGPASARLLARAGSLASTHGTSGGAVQVELEDEAGGRARAALLAERDGQRMAAWPAALAAAHLARGEGRGGGVLTAPELLGAPALLQALCRRGCRLVD